jgi:hypothetical protein
MKSKGSYILFPIVLVIWGFIAYRFVGFLKQDKFAISKSTNDEININQAGLTRDTFTISANYRDPFLSNIHYQPAPTSNSSTIKPAASATKISRPWPILAYHGLIKNTNTNKVNALLSINKKMKNVSTSDEIEGLKILNIQRDSIVVRFNNEKKSFGRTKK